VYVVVAACAAESTTNWHARSRIVVKSFIKIPPAEALAGSTQKRVSDPPMPRTWGIGALGGGF
jgi:hypothetical protein